MSEYNANDHLHNVTASIQQLTYQAQGVQDITGANVADYEQISPEASTSVTLVNARTDVPYLALINILPPVQDGEGEPGFENERPLTPYTKSIVSVGDAVYETVLPENFYGGSVDLVKRQIVLDIVKIRITYTGSWIESGTAGTFYTTSGIPAYVSNVDNRYAAGENVPVVFGSAANIPNATAGLYPQQTRLYYRPDSELEITTVDALKTWLEENPLYLYIRVSNPVIIPTDNTIPYVQKADEAITCEDGTLTIKYQGIAPDEP